MPGGTFTGMTDRSTAIALAHRPHWSRCVARTAAVVLLASWTSPVGAQERVAFRHLTIADGLSQNAVSAILQDRRGFMWFGTKDGLNRYDGYQFVVGDGHLEGDDVLPGFRCAIAEILE